jgi:membrane associated rhomboid family serine protease
LLAQIIVANVAVFIFVNIIHNFSSFNILSYLELPSFPEQLITRFWTLFTYMFTHLSLSHLFFNMIWLFSMGQIFNLLLTQNRLFPVYILGGLCGGILFIISYLFFPSLITGGYLIGASAAVSAISIIAAVMAPEMPVNLIFIGEVKLKWVVLGAFILSTLIDFSINTGGKISHIGGALFGLLYGVQMKKGNDILNGWYNVFKRRPKMKIVHGERAKSGFENRESDEEKLNFLLDKINKSGYESLTKSEKEQLHRLSRKN